MTIEVDIYTALKTLVNGEVYRDLADKGALLPRITFVAVGGAESINFLDSATIPDKGRCRVQVNVWAATRDAANALGRQIENTLRAYAALQTEVLGSFVAVYEPETKLYGTRQDFMFFG